MSSDYARERAPLVSIDDDFSEEHLPDEPSKTRDDSVPARPIAPPRLSLWLTVGCVLLAFVSGSMIVVQTALSVVLADVSGSTSFSNLFKFASALVLVTAIALIDWTNTKTAAPKLSGFWRNNIDAPEYYVPLMDASPAIRRHPWLFIYATGVLRAFGFVSIVFASQVSGYTVSSMVFVTCFITTSLLFDHFGVLGAPVRPFNGFKVIGVMSLVGGAIYVNVTLYKIEALTESWSLLLASCLCGCAGAILYVFSGAMNRILGTVIGSTWLSTSITISVCVVVLLVLWLSALGNGNRVDVSPLGQSQYWYLWLAAPVVLFPVVVSSVIPPFIGYAFFNGVSSTGLIVVSVLLDMFNVLTPAHVKINYANNRLANTMAGIAFIILGVILTRLELTISGVWNSWCGASSSQN